MSFKSAAVFCASSDGKKEGRHTTAYRSAAISLGKMLGKKGIHTYYGGAMSGLMWLVASTVLSSEEGSAGARVTGFSPSAMLRAGGETDKNTDTSNHSILHLTSPAVSKENMKNLNIVPVQSGHERWLNIIANSEVIFFLPGGYGTQEELFSVLSSRQLQLITSRNPKPIIILNVAGYYDALLLMIERAVEDGFIGDYDAVDRLAVFVDDDAARKAAKNSNKDPDWGEAYEAAMKEKQRIAKEEEEFGHPRSKYDWNIASDFDEKLSRFGTILYR